MRLVPSALTSPSRCAALPYIGRDHPLGYFDTGSELPGRGDQYDSHVYISVVAAQEMARMLDWAPPEDVAELKQALAASLLRVEELERERDEALAFKQAVDTIESADFRARKKSGRPKTKEPVS